MTWLTVQRMLTDSDRCSGDGSGILQRLSTPGDKRRGNDLRSQRSAYHQRADGGRHRVRPGQEGRIGTQRPHLRPRRRHLRCVDPDDRGRNLRGEVDVGRHPSRRRGLRQPHGEPLRAGVQA